MNITALTRGMKGILIFSIVLIVGFTIYNPVTVMKQKVIILSYINKFIGHSKASPAQTNSSNLTPGMISNQSRVELGPVTCLPNLSFNSLTANLKPIYKDFMMYRHCRDFPLMLKAHSCEGKNIFLLLVVKSLAENADRRASIRSTWGQERMIGGAWVRRVFLLGLMESRIRSQAVQAMVDLESEQHGDVVQWGFRESFFNVTLKETLFWKWFSEDCRAVKFVLKGDDDVFVNVDNVVEYLKDFNPSQDLYVGDVFRNWYPMRFKGSKYYIPLFLYGNEPYPPYAGGGGYLLSGTSIMKLYKASVSEELFPIDDAFVGICARRAKIEVVTHRGFRTYGNIPYDPCIYKGLMLVHRVTPNELWLIWSLLKDNTKTCSRLTRISLKL
ncbi:N-acetyllactosaminide beta-1,3-N-acetylglucosaminyltransferase 4-like [Heterodontus francisci]|uniref:N-acetyllactosaminide beta-1,3-N-acetylglucosaminyltransferase 4-like n=1 Tax=Heterodontus francisci TaxID=7792 RepID=UPI00355BE78F